MTLCNLTAKLQKNINYQLSIINYFVTLPTKGTVNDEETTHIGNGAVADSM
jgi:hypothetical protein